LVIQTGRPEQGVKKAWQSEKHQYEGLHAIRIAIFGVLESYEHAVNVFMDFAGKIKGYRLDGRRRNRICVGLGFLFAEGDCQRPWRSTPTL
jgi:hypothetical protein